MASNNRIPARVFTLAEANGLVREIELFTSEVVLSINGLREKYAFDQKDAELPDPALREVEEALEGWMERVASLGAHPKGYFTVDFQSLDPSMLYCWTYGEKEIAYTHKVWENFTHRRLLLQGISGEGDHMRWIH